ncbi:hypothetical protein LPB73_00890 [Tardiphaga sp. 37S4]|nr:hypothetical protein [Tardiphaga sp. 37S4]UFS76009.1 hypothetical protein LPB73_00890 [Tardiphaga sp. 37S4]
MQKKTRTPAAKSVKRSMKPAVRGSKALVSLPKSRASAVALTIRRLEAQLTQAEAKIAELRASAETDFLLDILNRRGFARELTRAVAIDQLTFVFRDINVSAGASAGVALLGPDVDGEAALVQADRAMYVRKTARRAKV